jgi:predicted DNA-binding protein (UPF0251 family)
MSRTIYVNGVACPIPAERDALGSYMENGHKTFIYDKDATCIVHRKGAIEGEYIGFGDAAIKLAIHGCVVPPKMRDDLRGRFHFDEHGRAIIAGRTQVARKRRRTSERKPTPLTTGQLEAFQLVAEHKGNVSSAARQAGKSRQAMKKLYDKAKEKLAATGVQLPKTVRLPVDKRGQAFVPRTSQRRRLKPISQEEN